MAKTIVVPEIVTFDFNVKTEEARGLIRISDVDSAYRARRVGRYVDGQRVGEQVEVTFTVLQDATTSNLIGIDGSAIAARFETEYTMNHQKQELDRIEKSRKLYDDNPLHRIVATVSGTVVPSREVAYKQIDDGHFWSDAVHVEVTVDNFKYRIGTNDRGQYTLTTSSYIKLKTSKDLNKIVEAMNHDVQLNRERREQVNEANRTADAQFEELKSKLPGVERDLDVTYVKIGNKHEPRKTTRYTTSGVTFQYGVVRRDEPAMIHDVRLGYLTVEQFKAVVNTLNAMRTNE